MKKLSLALAVLILTTAVSSFAGGINHQRCVELRGGLATYLFMDDPVTWAEQLTSNLDSEMSFAPDFGISLLYKSHNNFVWNVGYNHLFGSSVAYTLSGTDYDETVSANEIFLAPGFIFNPNGKLNFSVNAGATLIMATLDRSSPIQTGDLKEFYGATGRNLGFIGLLNVEYLFKPNIAIKIGGGFRSVFIDDITFISTNASGVEKSYTVVWTDAGGTQTNAPYQLDFTGVFAEIGFRFYFEPKRFW